MKVITEVNTDNIRKVIDTLENYSKYYLNKKEVFDISNYQTDNYDDISAFNGLLKKIKSNYNDISNNINNIVSYMQEYCNDIEGLENKVSEKGGIVKESNASIVASKISMSIDSSSVNDTELFEINTYNEQSSNTQEMSKYISKFIKETDRRISDNEIINTSDEEVGKATKISKIGNVLKSLLSFIDSKVETPELVIDDKVYNETYQEYTNPLESQKTLMKQYISAVDEELKEYETIENEFSRAKYHLRTIDDISMLSKESQKVIKEKFGTLEDYKKYISELKELKTSCETNIEQIEQNIDVAKYECLTVLSDYDKYQNKDKVDSSKITIENVEGVNYFTSYEEYCKRYGQVSELEYARGLEERISKLSNEAYSVDDHTKQLLNLIHVARTDETYSKIYNYLNDKYGVYEANEYLKVIENTVNQAIGKEKAQAYLNTLSKEENIKEAITNHLKVTGKGIDSGIQSSASGIEHAISAAGAFITGESPSRANTIEEYENMYLSQALASGDYTGAYLKDNYAISQGIGNMAPSIALSMAGGGAIGSALLGISAGGNSYHEMLTEGYTNSQALTYGVISGATESITEKFLGGISFFNDVPVDSFKSYIHSMAKEGLEEGGQEIFGEEVKSLITGEKIDGNELKGNVIQSALYGGITAGILNTPSMISSNITKLKVNNAIENNILDIELLAEDIKKIYMENGVSDSFYATKSNKELINDNTMLIYDNYKNIINDNFSIADISQTLSKKIDNITKNVLANNVNDITLKKAILNLPKSTVFFPAVVLSMENKVKYSPISSNINVKQNILDNGLYHITSENSAQAILDSGYVKSSGYFSSLGERKAYFFGGIPTLEQVSINLMSVAETQVAVKFNIDEANIENFSYRFKDDGAVVCKGNYNFDRQNAEIVYLGLKVDEHQNLRYEEISKKEYEMLKNAKSRKLFHGKLDDISSSLKSLSISFSKQADYFFENFYSSSNVDAAGAVTKDTINTFNESTPNSNNFTPNELLLSLSESDIENIGNNKVFELFKSSSLDTQKKFLNSNEDFFKNNSNMIFNQDFSVKSFDIILEKLGGFDFLKNNLFEIKNLSDDIQKNVLNKYKNILYEETPKQFFEFVKNLSNDNYKMQFIENSPFYSEMISSSEFPTLLSSIRDKDIIGKLIENPDAYNTLINNSFALKNYLSLLNVDEQSLYKNAVKNKILELCKNKSDSIFLDTKIADYLEGFDKSIRYELLRDNGLKNSLSLKTKIYLNETFNGVYSDILASGLNGNFDKESSKLLFDSAIYELMSDETIVAAALELPSEKYSDLAKLGNQKAIDAVIDKLIANDFKSIQMGYEGTLIDLYEAADPIGKQKIKDNIPIDTLFSTIGLFNSEQLVDIVIDKIKSKECRGISGDHLRAMANYNEEAYKKVINYLSKKQKLVAFNYEYVMQLGLEQEYIEAFREFPQLINIMNNYSSHNETIDFLSLLKENGDINKFYDNINTETVLELARKEAFTKLDLEKIKNMIEGFNFNRTSYSSYQYHYFSELLSHYETTQQLEILDSLESTDKYYMLFRGLVKNKDTKFKLIEEIISDNKFRKSIDADNLKYFDGFFDSLEPQYIDYILNNADNDFLGFLLSFSKRKDLNSKFNEMIKSNDLILNNFMYTDAELIYENLSAENKKLLTDKIDKFINDIGNNQINNLLKEATIPQKSLFAEAYKKGLINDEKLNVLSKIKEKNRFVLSTFNYSLFEEAIYKFGDKFLTKLSKYYDVVEQINQLKSNNDKFDLFVQSVINDNSSASSIVADQKMSFMLNYLLKNDVNAELLNIHDLTDLENARNIILKQVDLFSVVNGNNQEVKRERSLVTPDNYNLRNYNIKLAEKCDSLLKHATNVTEVQNLIFNKYFSMSLEDATELYRMYGSNFSSIKDLDANGIATTYLSKINDILNISSLENAKNVYSSLESTSSYNMNDTLNIINAIKQVYTKSLKATLFNPTKITNYVEYEGKKIPVYEPESDFQMLIQSTYTNYGGMPIINDSYFDSWNLSSRTANHGICCSLISNNNMGMAMVKGKGVVIGFNSFSNEQMNMMAPYDIFTMNDGYVIKSQRQLLYLPGKDVMNETRHTHNEFNLERTNLTGEGRLANIQPDYVVVFEEMSAEQKQNAYKASVDFNVPLVYINKSKLAQSESIKIDKLIKEYKSTGNVELIKSILTLHENNRSGYRNATDSELITKYFSADRVTNLLNEAIKNSDDIDNLLFIKNTIKDENRKFDVTNEKTQRINKIDIDIDSLLEKIDIKINDLQIEKAS